MNYFIKYENFFKFTTFICFFSIITSLILEKVFELTPCKLCLIERNLWFSYCFFSFLAIFMKNKYKRIFSYVLLVFSFLITLISFYHTGVEKGLFNNVINCSSKNYSRVLSVEELDAIIRNTKFSDCSIPAGYIFNLSFSTWSGIIALVLFIYTLTTLVINTNSKV